MATAGVAPPVINSAQRLEPGIAEAKLERNPVLPSQQLGSSPFPASNVFAEFIRPGQLPEPCPARVQFAGLRDPVLRMVRAIPLDVSTKRNTSLGQKKPERTEEVQAPEAKSSIRNRPVGWIHVCHLLSSQKLYERIVDLSSIVVDDPRCLAFHVLHQPIQIISRIGNANHSDSGAVP